MNTVYVLHTQYDGLEDNIFFTTKALAENYADLNQLDDVRVIELALVN